MDWNLTELVRNERVRGIDAQEFCAIRQLESSRADTSTDAAKSSGLRVT